MADHDFTYLIDDNRREHDPNVPREAVVDLLREVRDWLAGPGRWRPSASGGPVGSLCLVQAIYRLGQSEVVSGGPRALAWAALTEVLHRRYGRWVIPSNWNDEQESVDAVLVLIDDAIALETARRP